MSDKDLKLEKVGLKPRTIGVEECTPEVHGDKEIRKVLLTSDRLRGPTGERGVPGRRGRKGGQGIQGDQGVRGLRGFPGNNGSDGAQGERGALGPIGRQGAQGPIGPRPRHKWNGTKLSFEKPDGTFGPEVNLQGPTGGRGMSGRGSAGTREIWNNISLVGTDLIFANDKAGPLGSPATVVDLSSLAGGSGGFKGLGDWSFNTATGTPPALGELRFDNADPEAATEFYLSETNDDGEDLAGILALATAGSVFYLQSETDNNNFVTVEISSNTDSGTFRTFGIAQAVLQGSAFANGASIKVLASIGGSAAGSVVTGLTTEPVAGANITLTQTIGGDQVADTSNFLWLLGRAGGQIARGGTLAGQTLTLQGSAHANRGRNILAGGANVDWDWTTDAITAGGLYFNNTIPLSGGLVSAAITVRNTVGVNASTFIMSALDDNSTLTWSVAPGFAVTTLFFARQNYRSLTNGVAPAQAFIYAAQSQYWLTGAGDVTTQNYRALSFAPIIRVDSSGDDMRITNTTGLIVSPLYNTRNANSTADFGTIRGVHMANAATVLFGQSLGAEIATNWIGLDCEALTGLTVSGVKAAVRSAIPVATGNRFLQNTGGADSDFGAGDIHLNDNTYAKFGGAIGDGDIWLGWSTAQAALLFSTFAGVGGNPLFLRPTAQHEWTFQQSNTGTQDIGLGFNVNAVTFGVTAPTPNSNNWFVQFAGPNGRQVQINGEYSDVLWTASGSIDVDGNTVSDLQAFKINSPAVLLNGGTIDDISNLFVEAMPSFGATRTQALRVLGRSRLDGRVNLGSEAPAQLTANTNNLQLAANNGQRTVVRLDSDAAYNITGIDSSFGFAQAGDTVKLINIGAFNLTLTNQDAASTAANRIITSTGAAYILGPGDMVELWYDDSGTARWRMLAGTGA